MRRKVQALSGAVQSVQFAGPPTNAQVLSDLAGAHRAHQTVRFGYADVQGRASRRRAEPHGLVHTGRRWYLLAWDLDRDDWRTFRVDRIAGAVELGEAFMPRAIPGGSAAKLVLGAVSTEVYPVRAKVVFHAPREVVAERVPPAAGQLEVLDAERCMMRTGARDARLLALHLANVGVELEVLEPPELIDAVRELGERLMRAGKGCGAQPARQS